MAIAPKSIWKEAAEKAKADNYQPGNAWESILRKSLQRSKPELVQELGPDLENYLITKTARAQEMYRTMTCDQGMPADVAKELAMAELLGDGEE
ncbi:MAG TPA: hypothetical protein VG122_24915 [Gemmata sp.]|jgi:hypothetical protein|nr:hypothetical protein [Gemmata sp.]